MATETFEVNAEPRDDMGKGASRRLRHAGLVPAIVYGGETGPVALQMAHHHIAHHLDNEAFYSHILTLNIGGQSQRAVLKDVQRHPYKVQILHVDFQRVDDNTEIKMIVPLHFKNAEISPGVKKFGGTVRHTITDVQVICKAKDLPEYIEVDLAEMVPGSTVHLSDLPLPEGVKIAALVKGAKQNLPVASLFLGRGARDAIKGGGE